MSRFWRDGIFKSQRGFVGTAPGVAERRPTPETGRLLEPSVDPEPTDAEIWNRVGAVLVRQGETAGGIDAFRKALQLDPDHAEAHRQLAAVLNAHGRSTEAAVHHERFVHLTHRGRGETGHRPAGSGDRSDEPQPPERTSSWAPLGRMLVHDGVITEEQLGEALERQRTRKDRIGQILIEMKVIDEEVLLKYLGRQFRKEPITHRALESLDPEIVRLVPEDVARQHRIIATERHGRKLIVATADPLNVVALDDLRRATGLEVDFKIGAGHAIQQAIDDSYRVARVSTALEAVPELGTDAGAMTVLEETVDVQQLQSQAADPPVVKVVNYVLNRAAADGASDIHVEAHEHRTSIRYRIDGLLFDLLEVPRSMHLAVVSRLKIISRLDIAERRLPQDGSFASNLDGRGVDVRVSTLPTIHGEKVVLRLLEKEAVEQHYTLEGLGFEPEQLALFTRALQRPWGMVLLTGPTGSGKSTTLHTGLKAIKSPRKNIVTVEDPVEYRQAGIQQVQVKNEIGFDFARSLRSILRQDPDIIMVGEIRDAETAQIAVRAALTGHLVLSTLHTNDAVSTLVRLINIGVEPFLVATAVNVAAAQRLVKKICKHCKEAYRPEAEEAAMFGAKPVPEMLYRGRGCKECRNIGYSGRMALYEVFGINADVRRMVIDGMDADQVRKHAIDTGMVTLREAGLRKVVQGETTLEEVMSIVADQD